MPTTIATENEAVCSWGADWRDLWRRRRNLEEIVELVKEEFIQVMLCLRPEVNAVGFGTYEVLGIDKPPNRSVCPISSAIHVRISGYNDFS